MFNSKKHWYFLFLILTLAFLANPVLSAELKYAAILDSQDDRVLLKYGGLENPDNYLCLAGDLSCQNLGQTIPTEIEKSFEPAVTLAQKIKNVSYDRKNATRLTLSPDEKWLAYYDAALANKEKSRKFALINIATNKKSELVGKINYWDLLSEDLRLFHFSPDSQKLLYLDDRTGYPTLYLLDLTKPAKNYFPGRQLISKQYTVTDFFFWDSNTVYFSANRESPHSWSLYRYDLTTKDLQKIADNFSYYQKMRRFGNYLMFLQIKNNSSIPVLYDPSSKSLKYFSTFSGNGPVTGYNEQEIKLGSLSGVLVKPADYVASKKYPLIIWLHGGPYRQVSLGYHSYPGYAVYDWLLGDLAKNGALVLKLDYRGSYGYGRAYAEKIRGEIGRGDVADVNLALTELKKKYSISKVYLTGNSYGGYLALRTIVEPTIGRKFAGAMSINGVTDWFVLLDKLENSIFNTQFGGLLSEENSQLYYQADIVERLKNLKNQKIIIAQAEEDHTVPAKQADYLAAACVRKGVSAEMAKYAGEDHVFKKKASLENLCQRLASMVEIKASCNFSN